MQHVCEIRKSVLKKWPANSVGWRSTTARETG